MYYSAAGAGKYTLPAKRMTASGNEKHEIRMTKEARSPKSEGGARKTDTQGANSFPNSGFVLRISFVIRIS
jgi:hypothetical protein